MVQYLPVLVLTVLTCLFAALSFGASKLLAPRNPTVEKYAPYECGIIPGREPAQRFPVRFYLVAMLFVIFDIEIVFLYPWAVANQSLGLYGLVSVLLFSALLFESFIYLIAKGALEWGPVQISKRQGEFQSSARSALKPVKIKEYGVKVVGGDGRLEEAVVVEQLRAQTELPEAASA